MTGFDLRTFINNLEKLIAYTGERKNITKDDVKSVLERTRIDPIYPPAPVTKTVSITLPRTRN